MVGTERIEQKAPISDNEVSARFEELVDKEFGQIVDEIAGLNIPESAEQDLEHAQQRKPLDFGDSSCRHA